MSWSAFLWRNLARNKSGVQGKGMGILEPGESVLIVANEVAEEIVQGRERQPRLDLRGS